MWSAIMRTPKRHILAWFRVIWDIMRQNRSTGHFSRRVWEKNKNKKEKALFHVNTWNKAFSFADAPLRPICTKFGLRLCLMVIINPAKFYLDRLRGLDFAGGSNFDHSHQGHWEFPSTYWKIPRPATKFPFLKYSQTSHKRTLRSVNYSSFAGFSRTAFCKT